MDETKVISDESGRPSLSALRIRRVAPFPIDDVEVDESDEGDDNYEEVRAVESSIEDGPGSGGSAPSFAEEKYHERDDQDGEKPESSVADLRELEPSSSSPSSAGGAKTDHSDGEVKYITKILGLPPSTRSANQDVGAEDNRMSSLDILTMEMAVRSGDPKAVDDLMESLSDTLAMYELTTTYGDIFGSYEADKDHLYRGTSPILHAVQSGNLAMFESVMKAMQAKLSREQVKDMLAKKNMHQQSLLSLAARSGSKDVLEAVLLVIRREFTVYEVKYMLAKRDERDYSLVDMAARSGSKDVLEHVMSVLRRELSENEDVLAEDGRAAGLLLASAVRSGSMDVVEHVLLVIRQEFPENERRHAVIAVVTAASQSSMPVSNLHEVNEILQSTDSLGDSLLCCAASSGNSDMFNTVMNFVADDLDDDKKREILTSNDSGGASLLELAVISGSRNAFENVLKAVISCLTKHEVKEMILLGDNDGNSFLARLIATGRVEFFEGLIVTVADNLKEGAEVKDMFLHEDNHGNSFLTTVIATGRAEMFKGLMATVADKLTEAEVKNIISSRDGRGDSLLSLAASSQSVEMFKAVMIIVVDNLLEEEVKELISGDSYYGIGKVRSMAIITGRVEMFKAVMPTKSDKLTEEKVVELLCDNQEGFRITLLGEVIRHGTLSMCELMLRNVQEFLGHTKMQNELDAAFLLWKKLYEKDHRRRNITRESRLSRILSMLIRHSARPPSEFLQWAARDNTDGKTKMWPIVIESLLIGVESASNPLIPGMNLSVPLAEAADGAREGERKRLISLQKRVDEYVLEVLERLPQTIQGFDEEMTQCSALFEPEGPRNGSCGRYGPLRVAFERRHQMESMCAVPLVMDYLSRRFTSGLPDMQDSGRVLRDTNALSRLARVDVGGLVLGDTQDSFLREVLQGARAETPSITILPGAQFIIAGLLAKPNIYYRVPVMRMALDFVVYIMMLYFYSFWVLLHDDGPLTLGEILFAFYILAGVFTEAAEIRRNLKFYLQDPWNFFDALALVMLAGGFFVRLADGGSPWGRALYALSAPVVFSRILFFVQILQFQGPMIQVMFSMGMVLLQFVAVLLVVMMGFAMALYPLLRDDNGLTFDAILLILFKTMLGDVEAFEAFDEYAQNRFSTVGRLLLVVYLVVMTIMLLNLLIAVLSTKHTKVDVNAEKEFKVSRARIIEHYRLAVAFNILPAPLNLSQLVLTLPFLRNSQSAAQKYAYTKTMEAVGQVSSWLVLSPLFFAGGVLLWVTSSIYYICQLLAVPLSLRISLVPTARDSCRDVSLFFCCALGAPLFLLALWLRQPFLSIYNIVISPRIRLSQSGHGDSTPSTSSGGHKMPDANVHGLLEDVGVGASDLRKYLEDPMCDPDVRPDEVDRGTTVKHMKLLRDRLEKKFSERIDHLDKKFSEHVDHLGKELNERVDSLKNKFNERVDSLETNTNALVGETNRQIGKVLEILTGK